MKRRTAFLGTSAGTITTPRPKGGLERMMEAQERDRAIDIKAAYERVKAQFPKTLAILAESERAETIQAGGADKPRE